jgi:hypothetical protein
LHPRLKSGYCQEKQYASTPIQLAEYIAMKECFRKARDLLVAMVDDHACMPYLPPEILLSHLFVTLNAVHAKDILRDLYSKPIQRRLK